MTSQWNLVEQAKTGEVQYIRARLEKTDGTGDAQTLAAGQSSAIYNVSGYTQGYVSFQSPGITTIEIHGSVCTDTPGDFFLLKSELINSGGIDLFYTLPLKNIYIKNAGIVPLNTTIATGYINIFSAA